MLLARFLLVSQFPNLFGAQPARDFIGPPFPTGTLQPISGLIQLKSLDLSYCRELTGTAFVRAQPARDLIGRFSGTPAPLEGLNQLRKVDFRGTKLTGLSKLVSDYKCIVTRALAVSSQDSRSSAKPDRTVSCKDDSPARHD